MSFADLETGWLHKLSWLNIHRSWRRRYFVLHEKELRYYKHQGDIRPTGIIDLKHYNDIITCTTKQSPWSFRIESGCRYHASHILAAENEDERERWMERIRCHIQKQHRLHHQCVGSHLHPEPEQNPFATALKEGSESSVLDKWLERLDLQDDNMNNSIATPSSSPPSSTSSTVRLISTSLPQNYVYNHSATTVGCFDYQQPPFDSSVSTTGSILTTASESSPSSDSLTPPSTQKNTNASKASMLANAFAINAKSRLRRRRTSSSADKQQQQQQQQPASPRTSNDTTFSSQGSTSRMISHHHHQHSISNSHHQEHWASGLDIFHFEDDSAITYNESVRRSSVSSMTLPPIMGLSTFEQTFAAPPPQSPLPPPPRNNNGRRPSIHQPTSL